MTRYTPLWQQAGTYPASVDRGLISTLWPTSASSGGAVTVNTGTMTLNVAPGTASVALGAGNGSELCRWDAPETVGPLATAPPAGSSRIDLIVLQVRDTTIDSLGNNDFVFTYVTGVGGTPGPGAVPATPPNAYAIAQVTVPGGVANLNTATITDVHNALYTPQPPVGWLGRTQITANSGTVSTTTATPIPGTSVAVNVQANRRLRVTAFGNIQKDATAGTARLYVMEGPTTWTTRTLSLVYVPASGYQLCSAVYFADNPAAGSHTYALGLSSDVGGALIIASTTWPAWTLVEDIGPYP
jgi:hypothetical protein